MGMSVSDNGQLLFDCQKDYEQFRKEVRDFCSGQLLPDWPKDYEQLRKEVLDFCSEPVPDHFPDVVVDHLDNATIIVDLDAPAETGIQIDWKDKKSLLDDLLYSTLSLIEFGDTIRFTEAIVKLQRLALLLGKLRNSMGEL